MIRCTIELLPSGDETRARIIGCIEIALAAKNVGGSSTVGNYAVVLKKTPPFAGWALKDVWRRGSLVIGEDDEVIVGEVVGHHRTRRGPYDLLFRALKACGLEERCPSSRQSVGAE